MVSISVIIVCDTEKSYKAFTLTGCQYVFTDSSEKDQSGSSDANNISTTTRDTGRRNISGAFDNY